MIFQRFGKKKLVFVYGEKYKNRGATIMRGLQLSEMMQFHYGDVFNIMYQNSESRFRNSTLFLTKGAIQCLNESSLSRLKAHKNRLIFDPVDSLIPEKKIKFADAVVAASEAALIDYKVRYGAGFVYLIDHHSDPRIQKISSQRSRDKLRIGYFGEFVNTIITPAIKKQVDFTLVDTSQQNEAWFKKTGAYNMHYCLRNDETITAGTYKPFTKGINAAHIGANILAHRSQADAIRWLGEDYPYLIKSHLDEEAILEEIEHARKTFGTREWRDALRVMEQIRDQSSSKAICTQFENMLRNF